MDNARFILIVFFFFLSVMLYQQWQMDYGPKPPITTSATPEARQDSPDLPAAANARPQSW